MSDEIRKRGTLQELYPDIAGEWHPSKNGNLMPDQVTAFSRKKVWWIRPYDDPVTGNHFDFDWPAVISNRTLLGEGCPYLEGRKVWPGFNDLKTKCPGLSEEWHPTKNGSLTPEMVTAGSHKKVWWIRPYDDLVTGKHFDLVWEARIEKRAIRGEGCPYLEGQKVWPGFNDLKTKCPGLSMEWHPTKNGSLTPEMVTVSSTKKVWWIQPYDDPVTGKHFDFDWPAVISDRAIRGTGCPYLVGRKVWAGFNDLASSYPDIAAQWDYTRNDKSPDAVYKFTTRAYWWKCPKCGNEWLARVSDRTKRGIGCPNCKR